MSIGSLKTLFQMLTSAPTLSQVNVAFGEENLNREDMPTPLVVIVPVGGPWADPSDEPGYFQAADPNLNNIWMTQESIALHCWALDPDPDALPVDHAAACETLRAQVLQAFQNQVPQGLKFNPVNGRWVDMNNAANRFGRGYVLNVQCDIAVPDVSPTYETVSTVEINPAFEDSQ